MTAIIILNWNGANDTLACLESLAKAEGDFRTYVVDNGSSDDSLQRIEAWLGTHPTFDGRLIPLDRNYGFACGNNKGIAVARKDNPDYYLLLNNDTEVTPDFLLRLQEFAAAHQEYKVLTPKINYFFDKEKIWNCGGRLFYGFRKYFYAGSCNSEVKEKEYINISFVTGCALFFGHDMLDDNGKIFTERFFFGEEDFEFSLRMRKEKQKMACVLNSLVYHKVGASISLVVTPKIYLYYLNRFVDVRLNFGKCKYLFWVILNIPLLLLYFYKSTKSIRLTCKLVKNLLADARKKDCVTYDDFRNLILENSYFKFEI